MEQGEVPEIVERWKQLAAREPDARTRANYGGLALVFAEKRKRSAVWQKALEDWNVEESLIVKEWQEKAYKKGLEKGIEEGIEEGIEKGQSVLRGVLVALVRSRFGNGDVEAITQVIEKEKSLDQLAAWTTAVGLAQTMEEVRGIFLGPETNGV